MSARSEYIEVRSYGQPKPTSPMPGRGLLIDPYSLLSAKKPLRAHKAADKRRAMSRRWASCKVMDQGATSTCAGHAAAALARSEPFKVAAADSNPHDIYRWAQKNDVWPGEEPDYFGTSIGAVVKWLQSQGLVEKAFGTSSAHDLWCDIVEHGGALVGIKWTAGLESTDRQGFAKPGGTEYGYHALYVCGVDAHIDSFLWLNSHGASYGLGGIAKVKFADMQTLLNDRWSEAVVVREKKKQ